MKIYTVGGAVRDDLLGLEVKDRDYVVVGATPEQMTALGYKAVGRDFPVFLHPKSHEEYALARTERKTARGYHGFTFHAAPDVTLEQDLARRDLTVNAIARDESGAIVDPHGGVADLKAKVLRHVGPAFVEDPVRVLRVARFAARFDFSIAPETMALMRQIVASGEADALVAERVWQEIAKGLMEARPSRMFDVLQECGAITRVLPELEATMTEDERVTLNALDGAARAGEALEVRFAILARPLTPLAVEALCSHLKVPHECRDLALLAARHANILVDADQLDAREMLELFDAVDVWRKPERFTQLTTAVLTGVADTENARARLERTRSAVSSVNVGAIARMATEPHSIRVNIDAARLDAIRRAMEWH